MSDTEEIVVTASSNGSGPYADPYVLRAVGLSAGFAAKPFIVDFDFGVRSGEVVSLLGANGAGKTTVLMALAGLLKPARGHVELHGKPTTARLEDRARDGLAVITQERCVFMNLTVRDMLRLGQGSLAGTVELFPELEPHLDRRVGLLSGGQQQMLAVGRAISTNPKVLLADEVSLGLGPKIVDRLLETLSTAATERGIGVVLVEQHIHKALRFSDRACVLRRGRIELQAPSAELIGRGDDIKRLYL
jgi:branched-chain amino acid transport system ATP-binding protein